MRAARIAGAMPKMMQVTDATAVANPRTRQSVESVSVGAAALSRERVQQDVAEAAGEQQRNDRSGGSEHEAFGGELANQRHAGCADGHSHGDLPIARARARKQQVREVRARNQKNQRRDGKQEMQGVLISASEGR